MASYKVAQQAQIQQDKKKVQLVAILLHCYRLHHTLIPWHLLQALLLSPEVLKISFCEDQDMPDVFTFNTSTVREDFVSTLFGIHAVLLISAVYFIVFLSLNTMGV